MLKKAVICFVSLLLIGGGSYAYAELKAMTINTEWLWTPYDKHVDGKKFNKGDMSPSAYEKELSFYKKLILSNEIDVVALSEIENAQVAKELSSRLGSDWKAYFKQGRDTATGQDVALISRLSYMPGSLTDFGFPAGVLPGESKKKRLSKLVGAVFLHPETHEKVGIITSHFLSKRNDSAKKARNRLRQAYALEQAINAFMGVSSSVLVMGDLNDHRGSKVIRHLERRLMNTETECENTRRVPSSKSIDHILFQGLHCKRYQRFSLKRFSDHRAIAATFN